MTYIVAFRTHYWDQHVERLARRLESNCAHAKFVILYDETHGKAPKLDFELVLHTDDTSPFQIADIPRGNSLWYNADYALYFLHHAFPDYEHYVISEYDVAINAPIDPILQDIHKLGIDLVCHNVWPAGPAWSWYENGLKNFAKPWQCFLPFMITSKRALLTLLAKRQQISLTEKAQDRALWPFCETFVPSTLYESGLNLECLSRWVKTDHFRFRPFINVDDQVAYEPGSMAHPVRGGDNFISGVIHSNPGRDYFSPGSVLHSALSKDPLSAFAHHLRHRLEVEKDEVGLALLEKALHHQG